MPRLSHDEIVSLMEEEELLQEDLNPRDEYDLSQDRENWEPLPDWYELSVETPSNATDYPDFDW